MKAIVIEQPGNAEVLQWREYPDPQPASNEVRIAVKAAGINRADISQRKGRYPPPPRAPQDVPGLEVAGIVAQCGAGVTRWKSGDAVCALLEGGGYAQQVVVREGQCLPIPTGWTFAEAACLPETLCTVWHNVFQLGRLQAGETLLVHGGSGGIGTTAIQIARAKGARVLVTVGTNAKGEACLRLGAHRFVNYKTDDFETIFSEGADVILDMIGGAYLAKHINLLHNEGRLVHINAMDRSAATLDILKVMQKRLLITGSTLRASAYPFKKDLVAEVYSEIWPLIADGKFIPVLHQTFAMSEAAAAHRLMEDSEHIGKIILVNE